jgi:MATE family multidrug resistance protein
VVIAPLISVWSYQLDGMFIGATRTTEMRNAMIFSLAFFVLSSWFFSDHLGNHGLWLSLIMFNLVRALSLALYFPRLSQDLN